MSRSTYLWTPTVLLLAGAFAATFIGQQRSMTLEAPLRQAVPDTVAGMVGVSLEVPEEEAMVAGFSDYALYAYRPHTVEGEAEAEFEASLYLGYYDSQTQGRTIHSPRNCMPGSGWEALESSTHILPLPGAIEVNRYLLKNGDLRALVLYWYQGRGRVAHNEYLVKWDLLRDGAMRRRTDEALVRVVVPVDSSEEAALKVAEMIAARVQPALNGVLPRWDAGA